MKQNGAVHWPGPALLFFVFRFENLISGPKCYRDFRELGPRTAADGRDGIFSGNVHTIPDSFRSGTKITPNRATVHK